LLREQTCFEGKTGARKNVVATDDSTHWLAHGVQGRLWTACRAKRHGLGYLLPSAVVNRQSTTQGGKHPSGMSAGEAEGCSSGEHEDAWCEPTHENVRL
jgi:hypothetical protein